MTIPRRRFLGALLAAPLLRLHQPLAAAEATSPDPYGGWPAIKTTSADRFRVTRLHERWWFVTPTGHGFLSAGLNHYERAHFTTDANRDLWHYEDPARFTALVAGDLRALNLTTIGYGFPHAQQTIPMVHLVWLHPVKSVYHFGKPFPDPFSPTFEKEVAQRIARAASLFRDNPQLVGYYLHDCVDWPEDPPDSAPSSRPRPRWPDALKALPADAPGKRAFVACMRARHRDNIASFNRVHGTAFTDFDALATDTSFFNRPPTDPAAAAEDESAFIRALAERFYEATVPALRAGSPGHLMLGDIFNANRSVHPAVLETAARHIDVLSVQHFGAFPDIRERLRRWHALTGKPILIADTGFAVEPTKRAGTRVVVPTHADMLAEMEAYVTATFAEPYIVG